MAHIIWTTDYDTGFTDIDEQHRQLVADFNRLNDAADGSDLLQTAQALFDFTAALMAHFSYEEDMLAAAGYNLVEARRNMHQNFTGRLIKAQERLMENPAVLEELLSQTETALMRHITFNDRSYIGPVKASGIYRQTADGRYERIPADSQPQPVSETPVRTAAETPAPEPKKPQDDKPLGWATGVF